MREGQLVAVDLSNRSFELIKNKKYKEGLKMAERALAAKPQDKLKGAVYYNLGRAYEGLGILKKAKEMYQASLKVRPDNAATKQRLKLLMISSD